MKIDLVYLWCNDSDPIWNAKLLEALKNVSSAHNGGTGKARFRDNQELKYSLRSVEMYAPWINRIFIITDNQTPTWLDTSNPKIRIVHHSELFKPNELPLFNSLAIELSIAQIKDLSEHFLYANDDMMLGRNTPPSFFFKSNGMPKARFRKISKQKFNEDAENGLYAFTIKTACDAITHDFNQNFSGLIPIHQIDPYTKSSILQCIEKYREWSERTISHTFRSEDDLLRHLFSIFGLATKQYSEITYSYARKLLTYGLSVLGLRKGVDYGYYTLGSPGALPHIQKYRPQLLCFNDCDVVTDEDTERARQLFTTLYPKPSSFELK